MPIPFLTTSWTAAAEALAIGYLLGSIPFGLLLSFAFGEGDVRRIGSGNIGATNVLRTGNRTAAALTLLCDAGKGVAAVLLMRSWLGPDAALFAGLGAFLGHLFPVWLGFKGGKGGAVALGILFALYWPAGLVTAATWLAVLAGFRISSLATLSAAGLTPAYLYLFQQQHETILAIILGLLIIFSHRENIRRLLRGEEPRIGAQSKTA